MERIIGEKVIITETVDNIKGSGKTALNGVEWKVKSASGEVIEEGKIVTIEKIEGVIYIVVYIVTQNFVEKNTGVWKK